MAGTVALFAHTLMPGLGRTDDRTFVGAFQEIDRAIINGWFMASFVVALVFTGRAAVLQVWAEDRRALPWILAALVLYLGVFVVSVTVHAPRNDEIKAARDPAQISDVLEVCERFDEDRWARWNVARAVATTVGFGCLAWVLVDFVRPPESAGA